MIPFRLPRVFGGSAMVARDQDRAYRQVEALSRISGGPGIAVTVGSGGVTVSAEPDERWPAKIASHVSGGQYTATVQVPSAGGGWTPHPSGAVLKCWEYNASATIPTGTVVELRRVGGEWRFLMVSC